MQKILLEINSKKPKVVLVGNFPQKYRRRTSKGAFSKRHNGYLFHFTKDKLELGAVLCFRKSKMCILKKEKPTNAGRTSLNRLASGWCLQ